MSFTEWDAQASGTNQIVTFTVDNRTFGIGVSLVREIRALQPITPLAGAPAEVLGVITLRGGLLPIHDLRRRLGCAEAGEDISPVIIVVETGQQRVGLLADGVSDIVDITGATIRPVADVMGPGDGIVSHVAIRQNHIISLLETAHLARSSVRVSAEQAA